MWNVVKNTDTGSSRSTHLEALSTQKMTVSSSHTVQDKSNTVSWNTGKEIHPLISQCRKGEAGQEDGGRKTNWVGASHPATKSTKGSARLLTSSQSQQSEELVSQAWACPRVPVIHGQCLTGTRRHGLSANPAAITGYPREHLSLLSLLPSPP